MCDWGVAAADERRAQGTFRETWRLAWDPGLEVELVAAGAHGTTVLGAATTVMLRVADESSTLADVTAALEKSLLADLADACPSCCAASTPGRRWMRMSVT